MLSHERYNKALNASALIAKHWPNENIRTHQLDQQYLTQIAPGKLGVTDLNQPIATLPSVNVILPNVEVPPYPPNETFHVIQIAGTPHAGKTSVGMQVSKSYEAAIWCGDAYKEARQRGMNAVDIEYTTQQIVTGFDGEISRYIEMMENEVISHTPIFQERGRLDQVVMKRVHYLEGKTFFEEKELDIYHQIDSIAGDMMYNLALILCLVPPNIARERGSKWIYLDALHEQYLRMHYEMLNYQRLFGKPLPINYVCLDFSGTPDENQILLEKTVDTILAPAKFKRL